MLNQKKVIEVLDLYEDLKKNPFYDKLKLEEELLKVSKLSYEIDTMKFKIAVIGEFSTGKSTLINSFLQSHLQIPTKAANLIF